MKTPSTRQMVRYLKSQTGGLPLATRFQMVNRPRICPLDDLIKLVPPGRQVLDIGCGNGTFLLLLARYRAPSNLIGIDINPEAVNRAGRLLARCPFAASYQVALFDGQELPASLQTIDHVFLIDVLHHVPRLSQKVFLVSLFHAMQPGATLVFKDMDPSRRLLEKWNLLHDLIVARQRVHTLDASVTEQWLQDIGFEIAPARKQRRLCYAHYTIVARKP